MPRPCVLLVNPNRMRPPIGPLGLEYVAAALAKRGYDPVWCDLTLVEDWQAQVADAAQACSPVAVGVSVRNLDDAYFASQDFVLDETASIIRRIQALSDAPVVLGGVGFSIAPTEVLQYAGGQYGIVGEGEESFPALLDCILSGREPSAVAGAVYRAEADQIVVVSPTSARLADLDATLAAGRVFGDNARYFAEGGQAGIETKRGCPQSCIYCIEPEAKGRTVRLRNPDSVAAEFRALLDQGVDAVHLCDSEFNLPPDHARAVCDALARAGLAEHVRWYAYASPRPFDDDLAQAMARAGCVGINFGVDHGDPSMLERLGRRHGPEDILQTARACRDAGLTVMFDMLLGGPGETRESIERGIELMREAAPDRVGLSCGVRVYPNTPLARTLVSQGPLEGNPDLHGTVADNDNLLKPIFFVDRAVGQDIHRLVWSFVHDDPRFFAANPNDAGRNYNYNDNSELSQAIRAGARGAYWDILRKLHEG